MPHQPVRGLGDGQDVTEAQHRGQAGHARECPPVEAEEGEQQREEGAEVDHQPRYAVGRGPDPGGRDLTNGCQGASVVTSLT